MDDPVIDEISGSDPELAATLAAAGLPTDDLAEAGRWFFRFSDGGQLVGFVGWESSEPSCALLRSLAVVPSQRGKGFGRAMASWALTRLAELGVSDVFMLTTTAEPLALGLGFSRIDRAAAPSSIQRSRQFAALCPESAVLLHRSLP